MSLIFPVEIDEIGASATFAIYAIILAVGIYFIYLKVPETKGLSLEEITQKFLKKLTQTWHRRTKDLLRHC